MPTETIRPPLMRCPSCDCKVFVRPEGWTPDRVRCCACPWEGEIADLKRPRRHRTHTGEPKAVVIGVPADPPSAPALLRAARAAAGATDVSNGKEQR